MFFILRHPDPGEFLVAWQDYTGRSTDEITLKEGDVVELLETDEHVTSSKKLKLDPSLDVGSENLLDSSAAKHKLTLKPNRTRTSTRQSPTRHPLNARWLVREVKGQKREGWVPCQILQSVDEPVPGSGLAGDAAFRRQAVVKELVETEQEFVRDLDFVVQKYLIGSEKGQKKPKIVKDKFDLIFGNLKEISEFHRTVLMDGVKYYANEPHLLGKAFLRLERDFDKHINYYKEEPLAQAFLDDCQIARDYFNELSNRLGDDKTIAEHLKLPIQRINDYQLLLKELVRYSACLGEDNTNLQKALELMLSVPHRAQDDKFTNSIEGFRGDIHKLGHLIAHDWFSVTLGDITKERYLFLFKTKLLVSKVRRISDDRSVFQLKDIISLEQVEVKDHPENDYLIELCDKIGGKSLLVTSRSEKIKEHWLEELKNFVSEAPKDDLCIISAPASPPPEPKQKKQKLTQIVQTKVESKSVSQAVVSSTSEEGTISITTLEVEQGVATKTGIKEVLSESSSIFESTSKIIADKKTAPEEVQKCESEVKKAEVQTVGASVKTTAETKKEEVVQEVVEPKAKNKDRKSISLAELEVESVKKTAAEEIASNISKSAEKDLKKLEEASVKVCDRELSKEKPKTKVPVKEIQQSDTKAKVCQNKNGNAAPEEVKKATVVVSLQEDKLIDFKEASKKADLKSVVEATKEVEKDLNKLERASVEVCDKELSKEKPKTKVPVKEIQQSDTKAKVCQNKNGKAAPEEVKKAAVVVSLQEDNLIDFKEASKKAVVEATKEVEKDSNKLEQASVEVYDKELSKEKPKTKVSVKEKQQSDTKVKVCQNKNGKAAPEEVKKATVVVSLQKDKLIDSTVKEASKSVVEASKEEEIKQKSAIPKDKDVKCLEASLEFENPIDSDGNFSDTNEIKPTELKADLGKEKVKQIETVSHKVSEKKSTADSKKEFIRENQVASKELVPKKVKEVVVKNIKKENEPGKKELVNLQVSKEGITVGSVDNKETCIELSSSGSKTKTFETDSVVPSVDLNIVNEDIMSKKYQSAYGTTDAYGESSSYSRSAVRKSTYSSDSGLTSTSRYGAEALTSSKYGLDGGSSTLTGKYGAEASITSKYGTESSAISGRFSSDSLGGSKYDEITSKYGIRGVSTESENDSLSYGRKTLDFESKTSKYSRGMSEDSDKYGGDSSSYAKRSYLDNKESLTGSKYGEISSKYGRGLSADSEGASSYTRRSYSIDSKAIGGESKFDDFPLKYDRNISIESDKDASTYKQRNLSLDSSEPELSNYSRRYVKTERKSLVDLDEDGSTYRRKNNRASIDEEIDTRSDLYISKRSTKSHVSVEEGFDPDAYISKIKSRNGNGNSDSTSSYKRQSSRASADEEMDAGADIYVSKRTSKSQISMEEDFDPEAYIAKVRNRSENNDNNQSYRRTVSKEEDKKEMYKRSISQNDEENRLAKFEKYSRKSSDVSEQVETPSGNYKRTDSNSSTSHESIQTLADTSVISGEVISKAAEKATVKGKKDKKLEDMAPPDKTKSTKVDKSSKVSEEEDIELKKAGFIVKLRDAELLEDTYLRFMLKVKGEPHPTLTFLKDGVKISDKDKRVSINRDHSDRDFYELVIPDIKQEDAGVYKCIAKNEHGEESTEATVTITSSKHLFDDLADKDGPLPAGEKPAFIWKRDGIEFEPEERFKVIMGDDQDSLALIFQHVKPEDAGMYTCVAQTSAGNISCSAELTVQGQVYELHKEPEKPHLIIEKREALTTTGGSCMLEMKCLGFPKPKITIKHNGTPIEPGTKYKLVYEDDENIALVIKNVEGPDAGTYEVTAENELGKDVQEMHLTVKQPPKLKSKMMDTSAAADQPLKMTLEVEGIPKATVQFFKDGKPIQDTEHIKVVIDGDKYNIVIDQTNLGDSGSYSVALKNELAEVSESWDLNVYCAPKLLRGLAENKIVDLKDQVELSIQIEAKPEVEITWYKDGQEIISSEHLIISKDGDAYKLKISGAVSTDSASYKVKAKNIHGSVESECRVDVRRKPTFTSELQNMTVTEGDKNVTFDLKLDSFPKPTIKWYLDEVELLESRSEFTRYETNDGTKIVIKEVNHILSGQYTCKLLNDLGETSTNAKLTVHCKPRITKQLKDTIVEEGATLHLEVEVDCCPEASEVKWLRNGKEVYADARITITRDKQRLENYHLTVNLIKYEEQGEYEVHVTNIIGTVSSKSTVIVQKRMRIEAEEITETQKYIIEEVAEDSKKATLAKKDAKIDVEISKGSAQETKVNEAPEAQGILYDRIQIEEVFMAEDIEGPSPLIEEATDKSRRGKSVMFFSSLDIVEIDKEQQSPETDLKSKLGQLISDQEIDDNIEATYTFTLNPKIEKIRLQKGKRTTAGSIEFEELLEESTKQCGMVEDLSKDAEAIPKILDTNMRDGLQYESLDVSYTVKGWANPPPSATWTLNGTEIKPDSNRRMTIDQNGEEFRLDIVKLDPKDGGLFECKLRNAVGDVKQQAKLEVIPEAELRRPKVKDGLGLVDQSVMKYKPVTLTAIIIGDPIPEITWLLNGKEITSEEIEKHGIYLEARDVPIANGLKETTFSLLIPRCERENEGKYTIRAKNRWGVIESSATLTIRMAPEIDGPEYAKVIPGEPAELICVVQANPPATVTWSKSEKLITSGSHIVLSEDLAAETYKLRVVSAQVVDEGYYKVVAKNEYGQCESEGKIRLITEKPRFITGLQDSLVEHGGEISLMVRADGVPKPDLCWYHNENLIENSEEMQYAYSSDRQVACTYTIPNWNTIDEGIYKVSATNEVGQVETFAKITMVQSPPAFRLRLDRSKELGEGESLILRASVTGSPKPTIAWVKDGVTIRSDNERIKMEHGSDGSIVLRIEEVTPGDSGAWKLIVKNPNGDINGQCVVVVRPKSMRPRFTKCIKDTKVTLGEPLRLSAKVTGYPAPDIKWLKDGVPVRSSANVHLEHCPDGSIALVVDCVRPENAGNYVLIVGNKLGDITGDAKVGIEKRPVKPEFVIKLSPQIVVEGFPARFEVKAVGSPQPIVSWFRNGIEVISDAKHIRMKDLPDGTCFLVLDACNLARDGLNYTAKARNEGGEVSTSASLTVVLAANDNEPEEEPKLLQGLKDVTIDEGSVLKLEVPFSGNPIPTVQWAKDGVTIEPDERVFITCDGKKIDLLIDHAIPSDAGKYSVKLTNPLGTDSSQAQVTVNKVYSPPTFLQRLSDLQQLQNHDVKFEVRVSGIPQPDITWTKDGEVLNDSDKYRIKCDGGACSLYVKNCETADMGIYKATATNPEGQDSCQANLEVVNKEMKASQTFEAAYFVKRIVDIDLYKTMTARFTACAAGLPDPIVEWYRNDDERLHPSHRIRMERDPTGILRLIILGVDQNDLGKYSCKISNDYGSDICHAQLRLDEGVPHARSKRETDYEMESGAPMALADPPIISRMTDRHCTLSWKPSIPSGPRPPVTYQLEMLEMPNGEWFTVRSGIRSCVCDVGNLEPFRDYKFRIRVENQYGISDPSPYALTHREKLIPDPPRFVPYLLPGIDFRPETSPYFPRDFDIDRPPHDNMSQAPQFLRQEHSTQYGIKDQNCNLFWFVYGYPKPNMQYYFNDELIESGGRFDSSYTRNGQATLFINKMLDRDVGFYEAIATNEHGTARQRVRLEIAELPTFIKRPNIKYVMVRNQAKFEARILGVPYPEVKWYKDWKLLTSSSRIKIQFIEPDIHVLTINDAIYKDEGLYSVSARNVAGSTSASAMLYVDENDLEYNLHTYRPCNPVRLRKKPLIDGYDIGDELGRGTQGVTYHGVERINGHNYAAKIMHGRGDLKPLMHNELDILNQLHHRKLISLHDSYEYEDQLALILELAAGGELVKDYLIKKDYYTESDIAGFIKQILQGLDYMHSNGFAHMSLDIGDLLLSHPGSDDLKITDFSLSRRITMGHLASLKFGMPEYVSPECANGEGVGLGHDMWSVGIITYILLSGISPFRGANDMETIQKIQSGKWTFDESWWSKLSIECRDFISKLLVYQSDSRMDVHGALRHPWLDRNDKIRSEEYKISTKYLRDYYTLYKEWYDVANCRLWFRRKALECAFKHPSKMIYIPGERFTPPPGEPRERKPYTWEEKIPSRSPLNYEIGMFKSESHYQNGPDTYLLQLRDVDFPCRLREYMKVAASRGPGLAHILSDENGYDWRTPIIRERRRFTDIMDEEIDDERKSRINRYGTVDSSHTIRRLRHEVGTRLDTYAEAEAFLESKMDGRLPFFREKPQLAAMQEGREVQLSCLAVGEPKPAVQWFKNDAIIAESTRIRIDTDDVGRSHLTLCPALSFDLGMYKVVARNKIGQTIARTRIVYGTVSDPPESPIAAQISSNEALLTWRQPKNDGHAPIICYCLQYKLADDAAEWIVQAKNIDHEFYYMRGLKEGQNYVFRLAAKNAMGWSNDGEATGGILTHPAGAAKVQLSRAMMNLQQITDAGADPEMEPQTTLDYVVETTPIEWELQANVQDHYSFVSELASKDNINLVQENKSPEIGEENAYNFVSQIYRGKFSTVTKAIENKTDNLVVVKAIDVQALTVDLLEGEFAAIRSLRHERIASLLAAYRSEEMASFVLEKLQGADILTYLANRQEYTEQAVATIITQVLDGLQYLHWRGLCHLDLQPDNIVMCGVRSAQVKLVDFGCAHRVTKLGNKVPVVGHPDYICPEILAEEPAYPQSDIWSIGVLTYVMLSGTLPFRGADENETRQNILFVRYRFEHLYKEVSQEAVRFVMLLFKRRANKRPTAEECHENRWLLPTDHMIKKRERAVFLGSKLREYSDEYHAEKTRNALKETSILAGKSVLRSQSVQEELKTATA